MRTIVTYRAQDIRDQKVDPVTIVIGEPMPESRTLAAHQKLEDDQARAIASALWDSLPNGVFTRVHWLMMQRRLSDYVGRGGI